MWCETHRMRRIGYGYNRQEKDFAGHRVDRVWLDNHKTERLERSDALELAARPGDTIVVLARGDLGQGAEIPRIIKFIEGRGLTLEIVENAKPEPAAKRGRPTNFKPSALQSRRLRNHWLGVSKASHVYGLLLGMADWEDTPKNRQRARNWLNANIGPRGGGK